jgi:hypothetical protein
MKKLLIVALILIATLLSIGATGYRCPVTPTPTLQPTRTSTQLPTETSTQLPTETVTATFQPSETPTELPSSTPTEPSPPSATPTDTPEPSPTFTPTHTPTNTDEPPHVTPTSTPETWPTRTPTSTATSTANKRATDAPVRIVYRMAGQGAPNYEIYLPMTLRDDATHGGGGSGGSFGKEWSVKETPLQPDWKEWFRKEIQILLTMAFTLMGIRTVKVVWHG